MTPLHPNHPLLIAGRRHARDTFEAAAKIVRASAETKTADATSTLSTTLQLVVTTALVDGFDAQEVYGAIAGLMAWAVQRLPVADRQGVMAALVRQAIEQTVDMGERAVVN